MIFIISNIKKSAIALIGENKSTSMDYQRTRDMKSIEVLLSRVSASDENYAVKVSDPDQVAAILRGLECWIQTALIREAASMVSRGLQVDETPLPVDQQRDEG